MGRIWEEKTRQKQHNQPQVLKPGDWLSSVEESMKRYALVIDRLDADDWYVNVGCVRLDRAGGPHRIRLPPDCFS